MRRHEYLVTFRLDGIHQAALVTACTAAEAEDEMRRRLSGRPETVTSIAARRNR